MGKRQALIYDQDITCDCFSIVDLDSVGFANVVRCWLREVGSTSTIGYANGNCDIE